MQKIILLAVLFSLFLVSCVDQVQEFQNAQNEGNQIKQQTFIDPSDDGSIHDGDEPEPY